MVASLTGRNTGRVVAIHECPIDGSSGAATLGLARLTLQVRGQHDELEGVNVVRKDFRPLTSGRHKHGAEDPRHWAYWLREPLAYGSDVLPKGPGLRSPRCHGVFDSTVYLEHVPAGPIDPRRAARHLGAWQSGCVKPAFSWLSGHQLAQRVEVSNLDWSAVHADVRAATLWRSRTELLTKLSSVPHVLSHGDFSLGNLIASGHDTVALDWGTLGSAPVGADLAHLALSVQEDLQDDYLASLAGRFSEQLVTFAYRANLAIVGASRVHWMLSAGMEVPEGYVDFLWANRPRWD